MIKVGATGIEEEEEWECVHEKLHSHNIFGNKTGI
jgi:hypothetical protein